MDPRLASPNLEIFINDVLKEDLKYLEGHINWYNEEITEFVQLKNTIETLRESLPEEGFKTQMNIGGNMFLEAKVDNPDTMIVDVGKNVYLQFTMEEALKFAEFKIKVLTKESDVVREESIKKRADIKLALMCIADQEQMHLPEKS